MVLIMHRYIYTDIIQRCTMNAVTHNRWAWFSQALTQHKSFSAYLQPLIQIFSPRWSTDAYRAQVVDIRDEMLGMYTLVLKPQTGLIDTQWPEFKAGQFIELMVEKDGMRTLRCFSISSSPEYYSKTGLIELSIRIQQEGRITPWIRKSLIVGSIVNLSKAQGDFVLEETPAPLLFIAGGSGITPFRSMLQQQAMSPKSEELDIHLLYYSRNSEQIAFQQELEQLQIDHPNITIVFIDSEQHGFICGDHIQSFCPDYMRRISYICGPSPMIQQARKVLAEQGLSKEKIHFEFFGSAPIVSDFLDNNPNQEQTSTVHFHTSNLVSISDKNTPSTLLEQAEAQGLTPVSGCRIGVCHQCICKKKSGVVFNTRTQEYSDTGSEEIQLCISVAQSDVVLDL